MAAKPILPQPRLDAAGNEIRPWLLELMRRQAARKRPSALLEQFQSDAFVAPGLLDQRLAHRLDGLALGAAPEYQALLLSPVAPLGSCSVVAPTSQDRTLSTTRGSEVVSDPTNVLALECARRLRVAPHEPVRLCTVHQTLRAQPMPPKAGHSRHFRMFALVDAGLGLAADEFEISAIAAQLCAFDRLFDACEVALGCHFPRRRALLRVTARREVLGTRASERIAACLPHVQLSRTTLEASYYDGVRVSFGADTAAGDHLPMGDLGVFDWVSKLTSDGRMRFVAGGFGLQLVPVLFGRGSANGT